MTGSTHVQSQRQYLLTLHVIVYYSYSQINYHCNCGGLYWSQNNHSTTFETRGYHGKIIIPYQLRHALTILYHNPKNRDNYWTTAYSRQRGSKLDISEDVSMFYEYSSTKVVSTYL